MRIEKINENKIKVKITNSDLEERNIDINALNYNSPAAQELFWDMMEQAEVEFGFNASDAQIVIEAMPDTDDGYVVIITKLKEEEDFESIHSYIKDKLTTRKNLKIKGKLNSSKIYTSIAFYAFNCFDDLCELCKIISSIYTGNSTLYKYKNTYYLMILMRDFISNGKEELHLSEYGTKIDNVSLYEGFLNEYGTKIIDDNAIETINKHF